MQIKNITGIALFFSFIMFSSESMSISPESFTGLHAKPVVYGRHDMVVTNNPWASQVAARILKQGGNAIDAAVAAAFVLGLTEPSSSGLGGGGFALTYEHATKQLRAYDGRETAPHSATADLFLDATRQPMRFSDAMLSYKSVGVPSEVALLYKMQHQQGKLIWSKVVQPAINLAMRGFPMSPRLHDLLEIDQDLLRADPDIKAIYFTARGKIKPVNAVITNPAYASSLSRIAKNPDAFYTGKIARDIIAKINKIAGHAVFSMADFHQYVPVEDHGLCSDYRSYNLCSTPFASGGVTVLELMEIYANNYSGTTYSDTRWMYHFLEASKLAYADRNQYIADPKFVQQPLNGLLSTDYLVKRSTLVTNHALATPVTAGIPKGVGRHYASDTSPKGQGTTSIAIVDREGNAVSMTLTIEHQFGSHLFVDGFFLNNELTDFSFLSTDKHGKAIANRVAPFKRPRSAIAPVMVFDKHGELIAISGSPGGSQIICYVAKNLIQMLDFNRSPGVSSASGNLCAINEAPTIEIDSDLVGYLPELNRKGEESTLSELLSGVVNVKRAPEGGWYGAADPRREGVAIGE